MGITVTGVDGLLKRLSEVPEKVKNAVVDVLADAGNYAVEGIRSGELSDWVNQTGNLRSSVGFVVCHKGQVVQMSSFEVVMDGGDGAQKGRESAERLAAEYSSNGYALIIVAGEEYAVYVEAHENRVVLSSAYLQLEKQMPTFLRERIRNVLKYEDGR